MGESFFNKGAADSGVAILNTAIVVGFGGVVTEYTGDFNDLVTALKGMSMPPLVFVMITVAICAGACGSASGGMGVAFNALTDTYLQMPNSLTFIESQLLQQAHLDTLPHQGAQITLLGICKLTHKGSILGYRCYTDFHPIHLLWCIHLTCTVGLIELRKFLKLILMMKTVSDSHLCGGNRSFVCYR